MTERDPIRIDIVSDVMCPWCYIGKRRIEAAQALVPDIAVSLHWQPFQLDATLPAEGKDRRLYLEEKFGGPERADEIYARVREAGQSVGIPFAFDRITRSPNTLDAHRLILWASVTDRQDEVVERLFSAYFVEGKDLTQAETLIDIGVAAGMDRDKLAEALASDIDRDTVGRGIETAHRVGIQSVPTFIIDNRFLAMGAQPAEVLANALREAHGQPADDPAELAGDDSCFVG